MDDNDLLGKIRLQWEEFFALEANSDFYLNQIKDVMQKQANFDLSLYRDRYLKGRLFHRLRIKNITSFKDYLVILNKDPAEIKALKELLTIHTTDFFRDVTPFQYFERILLPKIASNMSSPDTPIRILSAPCSTGQEVYTFAMIAHNLRTRGIIRNPVEIYGVDIDEKSIEKAQIGLYRADEIKNMTPETIKQNFDILDKSNLRMKYEIRNYCHFQQTDLFKPLPFNEKFDLIACRNLLIYISREEQLQIISILKKNAKLGSYFLFGTTEGFLLMNETEFRVESLEEHYYQYLGENSSQKELPSDIRNLPSSIKNEPRSPKRKSSVVSKTEISPKITPSITSIVSQTPISPPSLSYKPERIVPSSQDSLNRSAIEKIKKTAPTPFPTPDLSKTSPSKMDVISPSYNQTKTGSPTVSESRKSPVNAEQQEIPSPVTKLSLPSVKSTKEPALESLSQTILPKIVPSPMVSETPLTPPQINQSIPDMIRDQIEKIVQDTPIQSSESFDKKVDVRPLSDVPKKASIFTDKTKRSENLSFLEMKAREKSDELSKIIQKAKDAQKERDTFRNEIQKVSKSVEEVPEIDKWLGFLQGEEKDKTDEIIKIVIAAKQAQKERDAVHNEIQRATAQLDELSGNKNQNAFIESREKEKAAEFDQIIEKAKKMKAVKEKSIVQIEQPSTFVEEIPQINEDRELNKWLEFLQNEEKEKNNELVKILEKAKQPENVSPISESVKNPKVKESNSPEDQKNAFIRAKEKEKEDEMALIIAKAKQVVKERKIEERDRSKSSEEPEKSSKKDKRLDFIRAKEKEKSDELAKIIEKAKRTQVQIDAFRVEINRVIRNSTETTEDNAHLEFIKAKEKEKADEFAKIVERAKKTQEEMDSYRTTIETQQIKKKRTTKP